MGTVVSRDSGMPITSSRLSPTYSQSRVPITVAPINNSNVKPIDFEKHKKLPKENNIEMSPKKSRRDITKADTYMSSGSEDSSDDRDVLAHRRLALVKSTRSVRSPKPATIVASPSKSISVYTSRSPRRPELVRSSKSKIKIKSPKKKERT